MKIVLVNGTQYAVTNASGTINQGLNASIQLESASDLTGLVAQLTDANVATIQVYDGDGDNEQLIGQYGNQHFVSVSMDADNLATITTSGTTEIEDRVSSLEEAVDTLVLSGLEV